LNESLIQTCDLTKLYGSFAAVDGLNLSVQKGETYGFLGPNGAGKTTTLMMLLGIIAPSSGKVKIFNQAMADNPFGIRRRLGVMAETQNFYEDMSAWEYLMFFARLYEVEKAEKKARSLMERVHLYPYRNVLLGGFSTGMQRKLGFVRALLHSPDVLILDEPVSGLDPYGIVQIREILNEEHAAGRTILISSHILSEIERTATRVGIIASGRLVFEDNMDRLRQKVSSKRRIELDLVDPDPQTLRSIQDLPFVIQAAQSNTLILVDTSDERDYRADLGRALAGMGAIIQGMRVVEKSLEEAFIILTEGSIQTLTGKDLSLSPKR
jgi:ABC-type multidrug transport system ATPase subunit